MRQLRSRLVGAVTVRSAGARGRNRPGRRLGGTDTTRISTLSPLLSAATGRLWLVSGLVQRLNTSNFSSGQAPSQGIVPLRSRSRMSAAWAWTSARDHRSNVNVIESRSAGRNSGLTCASKLTADPAKFGGRRCAAAEPAGTRRSSAPVTCSPAEVEQQPVNDRVDGQFAGRLCRVRPADQRRDDQVRGQQRRAMMPASAPRICSRRPGWPPSAA